MIGFANRLGGASHQTIDAVLGAVPPKYIDTKNSYLIEMLRELHHVREVRDATIINLQNVTLQQTSKQAPSVSAESLVCIFVSLLLYWLE